MPWVSSSMESRLEEVVFPEEEGPAIITTLILSLCFAIVSAALENCRSCSDSETRIRSSMRPSSMALLTEPSMWMFRFFCQLLYSSKIGRIRLYFSSAPICMFLPVTG